MPPFLSSLFVYKKGVKKMNEVQKLKAELDRLEAISNKMRERTWVIYERIEELMEKKQLRKGEK